MTLGFLLGAFHTVEPSIFGIKIDVHSTLTAIDEFTRKQASRNFFLRIIFAKGDAGRVQEYRERLRQSLDIFWVRTSGPNTRVSLAADLISW